MQDRNLVREETIVEEKSKTGAIINKYLKGRYLGKGGFAKCYEFTQLSTGRKYAAKIIEKATLTRSKAKEKLASQIEIHKSVKSEYVVKYQRSFEDAANVYIILELCTNQTLNQLIKRRKRISELEARYYLRQISLAIRDFQQQMIIHRDLKLGNLLLTENLEIRISDFGLAAKLTHPGERRKTMCGTPNYIAPEILENNSNLGHSYQVDIWSLGVIAYACLVGRPPFETNDVKTTYSKIKICNYSFPDHISLSNLTKNFIMKMLQKDPKHRLTIDEILTDEFFSLPIPETLPTTLLACPPNAHFLAKFQNYPQLELKNKESLDTQVELKHRDSSESQNQKTDRVLEKGESQRALVRTNSTEQLNKNLVGQRAASTAALTRGRMLSSKHQPARPTPTTQPLAQGPFIWVNFFEQNPKFGIAYSLNSNAVGMKFNDSTCMIANHHFQRMKYIDLMGKSEQQKQPKTFQISDVSQKLMKKFKIISYYQKELKNKKEIYESGLNNEQIIGRERTRFRETSDNAMTVWVTKHCKTTKANLFWFNNKDYQIIFQDFSELLFSKEHITYVNKVGDRRYFNKDSIDVQPEEIQKRVKYTLTIVQNIRENMRPGKENKPEEVQPQSLIRSSSVIKMQKTVPSMLKGSASTSRISSNNVRIMRY